jgi:hypothetical protein
MLGMGIGGMEWPIIQSQSTVWKYQTSTAMLAKYSTSKGCHGRGRSFSAANAAEGS